MMPSFRSRLGRRRADVCAVLLLVGVIFVVYGRAVFYGGDIWDDQSYLSLLRNGTSPKELFRVLFTPVLGLRSPLAIFTFRLEAALFGAGNAIPAAHAGNILWFALSAVGLYAVSRSIAIPGMPGDYRLPPLWAWAGTVLWSCHPQRVESVAWIAERKDVLIACCAWWSWFLFIRAHRAGKFGFGAFLLFLLSFAVKPALIFFPALLGVWILLETGGRRDPAPYRKLVPYAAVSIFALLFLLASLGPDKSQSVTSRLPVLLWCLGNYLVTAVVPIGFGPFHPFYPEPGWGLYCAALALLLLWAAAVLAFPRQRTALLQGVGGAVVVALFLLGPAAGLIRIGNADWADRYNLLPSALLLLIPTAAAAAGTQSRIRLTRCSCAAGFAGLLLWSVVNCWTYLPVWRDSDAVTTRAMKQKVPNYRVTFVAACRALAAGDAARYAETVKRLPPDFASNGVDAVNVAVFREAMAAAWAFRLGRSDEGVARTRRLLAGEHWRRITFISDGFPQLLLTSAAERCLQNGEVLRAAEMLEKLAECYPGEMEEFFYRGKAFQLRGDDRAALPQFEAAHRMAPRDPVILALVEETRAALRGELRPDGRAAPTGR